MNYVSQFAQIKKEYEKIINSKSFKLGNAIMKIPRKLKRIINKQRIKSSIKEKQLYEMLIKDSLVLKKQDLIISAQAEQIMKL